MNYRKREKEIVVRTTYRVLAKESSLNLRRDIDLTLTTSRLR